MRDEQQSEFGLDRLTCNAAPTRSELAAGESKNSVHGEVHVPRIGSVPRD